MKILFALLCYPPSVGGGELHTHQLAREMLALGHQVSVISQWTSSRRDFLTGSTLKCSERENYTYESVPVSRLGFDLHCRLRMTPWVIAYRALADNGLQFPEQKIAALMQEHIVALAPRFELIHAVRIGHPFLLRAAFNHARENSKPFVVTPLFHPERRGLRYAGEEEIFASADAVIALTRHEKRQLISLGIPRERIHITGCGPVLPALDAVGVKPASVFPDPPVVLFLGRHIGHKGYKELLASVPQVWKTHPGARFVFAGPQTQESRRVFANSSNSEIKVYERVSEDVKVRLINECTVLCVPSSQESFGGVYTEAWMLAKPVIGGPSPALADVIDHGIDGLLCEQSPDHIAGAIVHLLDHPDLAREMGRAGQEKVLRQYRWPVLAQKTLAIYQNLAGRECAA